MREIKFRARTIKSGEWVYGSYFRLNNEARIYFLSGIWVEVDLKTVGQFTGLKDKNGKEIYEGDILDFGNYSIAKYGRCLHIVYWNDEDAGFNSREIGFQKLTGFGLDLTGEVIGNICENEELLK